MTPVRPATTMLGAARPYAARLAAAALAGIAAELCGLGLIATAAWLIARAAQQPPLAALSLAIVAVRGFSLFKGVLRYVERLAGHDAALRALAELRGRVFDALAARRGTTRGPGDGAALVRLVSDVDAVQDLLLRCLLPAGAAAVTAATAVAVSVVVLPGAALVTGAGLLLAGLALPAATAALARRGASRAAADRERLATAALDLLDGADELAAFGATGRFTGAADAAARSLARTDLAAARRTGAVHAAGVLIQGLTAVLVTLTAVAAGAGEVAVAVLALTALVAAEAVVPLAGAAQRLVEVLPAARRVNAVLRTPPAPRPGNPRTLPPGPLPIEALGLRVTYGDGRGGAAALRGVDLRVERGRRVAVVGASGAGKSTLLAALSGEAVPAAGSVLLAGHDLGRYEPEEVRRAVRGLGQDDHVFTGTVRANLLPARPDATARELEAAARRARLLEVIEELPGGWDTVVGEGGHGLSGGQRQRLLLLARALLADPPVLLLDEPAEALDTATAEALTRDLLTAPGGGTLLLVTHRLAALDAADEVIVLDRGRIAQRGTHTALIARPGPYRDLWETERFNRGSGTRS